MGRILYEEDMMQLIHEYHSKDNSRSAYLYKTDGGEYVVITTVNSEERDTFHRQDDAESFAEDFV